MTKFEKFEESNLIDLDKVKGGFGEELIPDSGNGTDSTTGTTPTKTSGSKGGFAVGGFSPG